MKAQVSEPSVGTNEPGEGGSLSDVMYGRIRNDILFGQLEPGRKLKLDALRDVYKAGVNTLREVLNRLVSDGLIVAEGQKGFRVAPVSERDLHEVAELRELHETFGLRRSIERGDLDWDGRVVAAHYKLDLLERRMISGDDIDVQLWKRYDREFHAALISACGSQALMRIHGAIYDQFLRYQMVAFRRASMFRGQAAADEHRQLRDFALARDADSAVRVLRDHIWKGATLPKDSDTGPVRQMR